MKRILSMLLCLLLCGAACAESARPLPVPSEVGEAAALAEVLSRHDSVTMYSCLTDYATGEEDVRETSVHYTRNGTGVTMVSSNAAGSIVYDGENCCMIDVAGSVGMFLSFDGSLNEYYDALISEEAFYVPAPDERVESCVRDGDEFILRTRLPHSSYADTNGTSFDLEDEVELLYVLTLDVYTLDLKTLSLYACPISGVELPLIDCSFTYDEPALPEEYLSAVDPLATRNVLVTPAEGEPVSFVLAEGVTPIFVLPDGMKPVFADGTAYSEETCPLTGDLELMLVSEE